MKNVYRDGERSPNLALKPYLREGETVLWTGTPFEKAAYRPPLPAILFLCFWFAFVIFWTVSASVMGGAFGLFGIPFLLVGGFMLWFLTAGIARQGRHTLYAVTDSRAIILIETSRGMSCLDYAFSRLSGVSLRNVRNGSGTIEFLSPETMYLRSISYGAATRRGRLYGGSFEMIADVDRVYRMISERIAGGTAGEDAAV